MSNAGGENGFYPELQRLVVEEKAPRRDVDLYGMQQKPYRQADFDQLYLYSKPRKPPFQERVNRAKKRFNPRRTCLSLFPIIHWLWHYEWKKDLFSDVISGISVAIMHIPHGIAYSMLGGVPPVVGIYMAFFPVFIYVAMGTSRHISMGTFSVVCIMTSKAVFMYSNPEAPESLNASLSSNETVLTPVQVAAAVSLTVGLWQVLMGVLQLGVLSVLLSDTLVSGFTTGAAVHVITSQISKFFGIKLPVRTGPLKIIYAYYDLCIHIPEANVVTTSISAVTILLLCLYNELLKGRIEKKVPFPIPIELFAIILGTIVSYLANFEQSFGVKTIGDVPTGLPSPSIPPFRLLPSLIVDGLVISLVAFSVNMSMAKILARKANYSVSGNQELLASGCANVFGSFFGCIPVAASLSRSMIQQTVGGKTQLASLVSCALLLMILLFAGPLFEPLPNCVLASIVVVALKGMLMQVKELFRAWKQSPMDGMVWLVSFLGVVLLDIDYGLGLGVLMSVLALLVQGQKPQLRVLGSVPGTQIYLDMYCYQSAVEVPGVRIVQVAGNIHFANKDYFQNKIMCLIGVEEKRGYNQNGCEEISVLAQADAKHGLQTKLICLVLDMTAVSFIDPSGAKCLTSLYKDCKDRGFLFCIASCSWTIFENLNKCGFFKEFPESQLFPTIHDGVSFAVTYSGSS